MTQGGSQRYAMDESHKLERIYIFTVQNLHSILPENAAGILLLAENGTILKANEIFLEMLEYEARQLAEVGWDTLTPQESRAGDRARFEELQESGHAGPWRTQFIASNGDRVPVLVEAERVPGDSEGFVGAALVPPNADSADQGPQPLAGRLLKVYDEERRRIARELHDATAQNLAALSMNLAMLAGLVDGPPRSHEIIRECCSLTEECLKEVRSLSYMLHPPLLDELGLETALRTFLTLYERRTGVSVNLVVADSVRRLPRELEMGAFRVTQECLFNVERHSGSAKAEVRLASIDSTFQVSVRDWGKGITPEAARGESLGIAGMRERVRLLGGQIEILAADPGTLVRAVFQIDQ